jgi:CPA1 family monovalent cation:H+ antiporter
LLIVSLVAIIVRRFRIPYTVALVLAGFVLSFQSRLAIDLTPDLILSLFLPPLLFEAAFHINFDQLRQNLATIVLLAVPGVILNMLLVGGVVAWGAGFPFSIALVFGALIAATDPVSVVAIFRKIGVPKRLEVLLEGESLLNDGTAIVIFNLALVAVATGSFDIAGGVLDFLRIAGGGIVVGGVAGWLVSRLIRQIDDYLIETTLTTIVAFGSFLAAEQLHVSGVLAVVTGGLVVGNIGPRGMTPTTRIVVFNFWEYIAFLANSAVFLIIGLEIDLPGLTAVWQPALWAIGAVLVSRAVVVYLFSRIGSEMPARWRHVLFWGGLRGAIALALALSLPRTLGPARETIILMTFAVVLFTLLAQGLTMDWLIQRLKIIFRSEEQMEYERRNARALAARAGFQHLERLHGDGLISSHSWTSLKSIFEKRVEALTEAVQEALHETPGLEMDEIATAQRESLHAQRSMLGNLRRDGVISDRTYEELIVEIDAAMDSQVELWAPEALHEMAPMDIEYLLFVVVQQRDLESAINALANRGIPSTSIRSHGGFLRGQNHTLLVGIPKGKMGIALSALEQTCKARVEYLQSPSEVYPFTATPIPIQVEGATIFAFEVDRYEVI